MGALISQLFPDTADRKTGRVLGFGGRESRSPFNVHLQIGADGQHGRCGFQSGGVVETFKVGCEEEGRAVEFGKGVGGFDDGVAEAFQDGVVERVEDGVLEDGVSDLVLLACG